MATVRRKIHFFTFEPDKDDESFSRRALRKELAKLKFTDRSVYLDDEINNERLAFWDQSRSNDIVRIAFAKLKLTDYPEEEFHGETEPLELKPGRTLCFKTHIVFFDASVVAAEYNDAGPRAERFAYYLRKMCPDLPKGRFIRIYEEDALAAFSRFRDIRLLDVSLPMPHIGVLKNKSPDVYDGMGLIGKSCPEARIEVKLLPPDNSKKGVAKVVHAIGEIAGKMVRNKALLKQADRFCIKGYDIDQGRVRDLDLLEQMVVSEATVNQIDEEHGVVDSDEMFEGIISAYQKLKPKIDRATGKTT